MALRSATRGANYISCGSATSIDNLSALTYICIVNITDISDNDYGLMGIGTFPGANRKDFNIDIASGVGTAAFVVDRATTDTFAAAPWTAATGWHFFAAVDPGAGTAPRMLYGTLATVPVEPTYGTQTTGVGTVGSSAAANFRCQNIGNGDRSFIGNSGLYMVFNRGLSNGEILSLWRQPRALSGCVLYLKPGYAGTGTQHDLSGNGNNGTITGTLTVADDVPLGPPFGFGMGWQGAFTAAAAAGGGYRSLLTLGVGA